MSANRYGVTLALKEHLAAGNPITRLEAMVYFGVPNLTSNISKMRQEGWMMRSKKVSFLKVLLRINKVAVLKPPQNLPVNEIEMTEYWVEK
jgi:Helix-turn-helix domain